MPSSDRQREQVLFWHGLSNVTEIVRGLRRADPGARLGIAVGHGDADFPARSLADSFIHDPSPDRRMRRARALQVCRERRVDVVWPTAWPYLDNAEEFHALGTVSISSCRPETAALLDDKAAFYADLAGTGLPIPAWRTFATLDEFDAVRADLRPSFPDLCIKPCVSIYAMGFRRIAEDSDDWGRFMANEQYRIGLEELRRLLAAPRKESRPFMLMPFLAGEERSVDCLAMDGLPVRAVARVKRGRVQHLETSGPAIDIAEALVRRYRLNGIVNVQTRDHGGRTYVLEVNARMAGGVSYSCLTGLEMPYWAIRLALGQAEPGDVPYPAPGVVAPYQEAMLLPDPV